MRSSRVLVFTFAVGAFLVALAVLDRMAFRSGNEWLILTAAGPSHDLDGDALGALSRGLQAVAGRLSDSLPLLRLG